jgi:uncharacterized membrane protein YdjX (TVP38/TMEM64 family)
MLWKIVLVNSYTDFISKVNLRRYIRPIFGFLIIAVIVLISWYFNLASYINLEKIRQWVDVAGPFAPLSFICLCIVGVLLHLPELILIAIGGVLFGSVRGFIYGWIGSITGSTITFLFVRYFMKDAFQRKVAGRFKYLRNLDDHFVKHGFSTMLILRIFLFMSPPINWFIAVTRVRFSHYFAGSMLGIIPGVAITAYAADNIAGIKSLSDLLTPQHIMAMLLIILLIAVTSIAAWKIFRKGDEDKILGG